MHFKSEKLVGHQSPTYVKHIVSDTSTIASQLLHKNYNECIYKKAVIKGRVLKQNIFLDNYAIY